MGRDGTRLELIEKVSKLMALAEDKGATPAEKKLAAEHAARIMLKYGLQERDIRVDNKTAEKVIRHDYNIGPRAPTWEGVLAVHITRLFDTRIVRSKRWDLENGKTVQNTYLVFIGLPKDVDVSVYFFQHLRRSVGNKTRQARTRNKSDFALGMTDRLNERMEEAFRFRYQFAEEAGCTDLILVKDKLVTEAMAEMFGKLRKGGRITLRNREAYMSGRKEGDKVNISRPIAHNGAASGRKRLGS